MAVKHYIAVDLGAESGRVMLATVDGRQMKLRQMHRFANGPVGQGDSLRWDFDYLVGEIEKGLARTLSVEPEITSMAVDTWGVDFGLVDSRAGLLENPYHYRHSRTDGIFEQAFKVMSAEDIYANTGIQLMPINTLFQLLAYRRDDSELFSRAHKLLFMPNLIDYFLTGRVHAERTIASTSSLLDARTGRWSHAVLEAFDIDAGLLPAVIEPCSVIGPINEQLAGRLGCRAFDVVAVGSHDTASAVAGAAATGPGPWAFLSSGTWSLMGCELSEPIISDKSFEYQFTNEAGLAGTVRFLKNITGLWIVQQCRQFWAEAGVDLSYSELTEMAEKAQAGTARIDVDHEPFLSCGDMPTKINEYLASTGQRAIEDKGQMIRVVLESLANRYASVLKMLEETTGRQVELLHMVGGGIKNSLLNQLTADAIGKKVVAGPVEATVAGNVVAQAMASGQIDTLGQGRQIIAESFESQHYEPARG